MAEWIRGNDMVKWTTENIDRIKSSSESAVRKLESAKRVLKQSFSLIDSAYTFIKKISETTIENFTGFKNVCEYFFKNELSKEQVFYYLGFITCSYNIRNFYILCKLNLIVFNLRKN